MAGSFEIDIESGVSSAALQLLGMFEQAQTSVDDLVKRSLLRAGPRTAEALGRNLQRVGFETRKEYLRAVLADVGSEAPVERLVQVYGDARPVRVRIAHASWTLPVIRDGKQGPIVYDGHVGPTLYVAPKLPGQDTFDKAATLFELQVHVHRLIWFQRWLVWVSFTSPDLAKPGPEAALERRVFAATVVRPSSEPPSAPSLE